MPGDIVLHVRYALALRALSDNNAGLTLARLRRLYCSVDGFKIVRVAVDNVLAERLELLAVRSRIHDVLDRPVDLKSVPVEYVAKIVELVVSGEHRGLPDFALFALAVAHQSPDAAARLVKLCRERHSASGGNALPERTCRHIDAGRLIEIGMSLKVTCGLSERLEILYREISAVSEHGLKTGGNVSF